MKSDVDRDFFNIGWTLGRAHAHADLARAVAQAYADGWNARAALVTDTPSNERDAHVVVH
jgi:hypothetical protein